MKILAAHKQPHEEYFTALSMRLISAGRCVSNFRFWFPLGTAGALFFLALPQIGCSRISNPLATNHPLNPVELFQKVSPSVFVVQALDESGKPIMLGSGVALARDFLITNCHVVQKGSSFKVVRGKATWDASLIQAKPDHDLCGLRPKGLTLNPVEVRPSSKLATGERVYAIGSPEGLELTFSEGVISALRDTEGVHTIQTTAAISPGSSGGGLFDAQGNLVGITTLYLKEGQDLNFALPGEWIKALHDDADQASRKSSPPPGDAELESAAWLVMGHEAVKNEDYALALHSFGRCTALNQSQAAQAWLESGKIWAKDKYAPESDRYKSWICSESSLRAKCFLGSETTSVAEQAEANAKAAFEKAIEINPDYAEAWLELAKIYDSRREYDRAVSAAKEATRLAPGNWEAWETLGVAYAAAESYDEAISALQHAEKVAPDKSSQLRMKFGEGVVYSKKRDRKEVLRIYQELKTSNPNVAEGFFKHFVLPQSEAHPSSKYSKVDTELLKILRSAQTTDATRQAAWDTFHAATNEDDFVRRLDSLALTEDLKMKLRKLWKSGSKSPSGK